MQRFLAIFALALYILPVQAYAQPDKTQQTYKSDKPSLPAAPIVPQQGDSPSLQNEAKDHIDADVRVVSAPGKDCYDKAAFWVNLALVAVGFAGVIAAVCTLKKIERQTAATEVAANAAKISADIAVGTSLPTLVIHGLGTGDTGTADVEAFFQSPKIKISIKNYGQTPAFLKWWTLCFTCEALPEVPNYYHGPADGMILDKVVVQPDTTYTLPELFYPHRQEFSVEDARAIVRGEKAFRVYGYVCYGDIFGNPLKRLKFCEAVLNILGLYSTEEVCDWWEGFCPSAYTGTDLLPATKEPAQQKTE